MAGEPTPRRPFVAAAADECKERAEEYLGSDGQAGRAIAWAVLAVAAELHIIRKSLSRR